MIERISIPSADVRGMQVIAGALLLGVLTFAAIAVFLVQFGSMPLHDGHPIVSMIMAGFAFIQLIAAGVVPPLVGQVSIGATISDLIMTYRTRLILRYALCEGGCFANLVAYIVEGQWWTLAIVAALVFVLLTMFPTRTSLEHWIETQQMMSEGTR